jgi:hypothetical protein
MKRKIIILSIFSLPFNLFSQSGNLLNNNSKPPAFNENHLLLKDTSVKKNLFCIDIGFPTLAFSYTRNIKNSKWYLGGGLGFYGDIMVLKYEVKNAYSLSDKHFFLETRTSNLYEILNISFQSNYIFSKNFMLRTGITWQEIYVSNLEHQGAFTGLYISPLFGLKHFKIGTRFLIGLVQFSGLEPLIYYNPIIFFSFNL